MGLEMDGWSSGLRHRAITPAHLLVAGAVGSNPTPSAIRYGANNMLDFEADIEFVKSQLAFHEAQAVKYANEPRRAARF